MTSPVKHMKDQDLIARLKVLAHHERKLLAELIDVLREVDRRRLFLNFGFPSMFEYLTKGLGYSAGAAQRRLDAARLLRLSPQLKEDLGSGKIQLSQTSLVARALREIKKEKPEVQINKEQKLELLEMIKETDQRT